MASHPLHREYYSVGWVCALPIELAAAQVILDEEHQHLGQNPNDTNLYTLGRIGEHNVVIACLPAGQTGTNSAAAVAMQMKSAFPSIRFGLMVGIGGGVPSEEDVRLGDVVVSQPQKRHGGVVQYDFGKSTPSGFEQTGFLNIPPTILLNAVSKIRANHLRGKSSLSGYLAKLTALPAFAHENAGPDVLFEASYNHVGGPTCGSCVKERAAERQPRRNQEIVIHYGTIASGNQVMRDGTTRDSVSSEFGGVLCFEMEAAGLMNTFPCLMIRGICDYADSHKNKKWQAYAAGTAAAYAKEVLSVIPTIEVLTTPTLDETIKRTSDAGQYKTPFSLRGVPVLNKFVDIPRDDDEVDENNQQSTGFEKETTVWADESLRIKDLEPDKTVLRDEFMSAELHSPDPNLKKSLQLFRQSDKYFTMIITNIDISAGRNREMWEREAIGLERAHLIPAYDIKDSTVGGLVLKFKNDEQNPLPRTLIFKEPQQMLKFQQAITGYKVVYDVPDIKLTYHQSKFLGGSTSTFIGRIQIWNASRGRISLLSLLASLDISPGRNLRRVSTNFSFTSSPTGVLGTRRVSIASDCISATSSGSSEQRNAVLSESTVHQSSDTPSAVIFSAPIPPCLVIFAQEKDSSRSFFVVEVDGLTLLNKDLCDCHDSRKSCLRTVIERRSSNITATKSKNITDPNDWNIAHAGRYQRKARLDPVKRVKNLVFEFHSAIERSKFEQKFEEVSGLLRIRVNECGAIK